MITHDHNDEQLEVNRCNSIIDQVQDYINTLNPPKDFSPTNTENTLIQMDRSFEGLCSALVDMGVSEPKKLPLLEFHSRIDHFEKKNKETPKGEI